MELAKYTTSLPFIHHTPALPPSARIAWTVLPTTYIDSGIRRCCTAHACRKISKTITAVGNTRLDSGLYAGLPRSYSNGGSPSNDGRVRHGVMRLDWVLIKPGTGILCRAGDQHSLQRLAPALKKKDHWTRLLQLQLKDLVVSLGTFFPCSGDGRRPAQGLQTESPAGQIDVR